MDIMSLWSVLKARYGSNPGEIDQVRMDKSTNSFSVVEFPVHKIHDEDSFSAFYEVLTANVDNARTAIGFTTANTTKWLHMVMRASASAFAEGFIEETPTIDDDAGTQIDVINRNRNSSNTSGALSLETIPVVNKVTTFTEAQIAAANYVAGTALERVFVAAGSGPQALGGTVRSDRVWILKQNTKYLFYIQNVGAPGAGGNQHEIHLDWYEHTNKH
jgi:hypothetical protein